MPGKTQQQSEVTRNASGSSPPRLSPKRPSDMVAVHEAAHGVVSQRLGLDTPREVTLRYHGNFGPREVWSGSCNGLGFALGDVTPEYLKEAKAMGKVRLLLAGSEGRVMVSMAGAAAQLAFDDQDGDMMLCADMTDVILVQFGFDCDRCGNQDDEEVKALGAWNWDPDHTDYSDAHVILAAFIPNAQERHDRIVELADKVLAYVRRPCVKKAIGRVARAILASKREPIVDSEPGQAVEVIRFDWRGSRVCDSVGYGQDSVWRKAA